MIVWINGAFGAGKTTLAGAVRGRVPEALGFHPECVGFLLRQWVPGPVADFQDIPLWRRLTAEFVVGLWREYGRVLVVPMTVLDGGYRDEIFGLIEGAGVGVLHVFLEVPAEELRRRIEGQVLDADPERDARAREFRLGNVARGVAAREAVPAGTVVLRADLMGPAELAERVVGAMPALWRGGGWRRSRG